MRTATADPLRVTLVAWLEEFRLRTRRLLAPLTDDDLERQHDPIMSPLIWDVGHVANFEELWLLREVGGRRPIDARLDAVYNPFDNPRSVRADLDILRRTEAFEYLDDVRASALSVMRAVAFDPARPLVRDGYVWSMVAQHEAQHQETMLQALDLRGDLPPYEPALGRVVARPRAVDDTERVAIPAGPFDQGTDDTAHAYDNERPTWRVDLGAFAIDRFPVSARRYADFIDRGGYDREEWWSPHGWAWRNETGHRMPQGWSPASRGGWLVRRFGSVFPLDPVEIVEHVSYWEAEAFCASVGGRLPTESEWEKAARWDPAARRSRRYPWGDEAPAADRANLDHRAFGPSTVGAYPSGASAYGVEQMIGDVYEWTASTFSPYPGYATFPYPEYSEVFFGDDYRVLRGASWATGSLVARPTFRNWDYPQRRQIFAGIRVAYDRPA